jgi:hypothetical protein
MPKAGGNRREVPLPLTHVCRWQLGDSFSQQRHKRVTIRGQHVARHLRLDNRPRPAQQAVEELSHRGQVAVLGLFDQPGHKRPMAAFCVANL